MLAVVSYVLISPGQKDDALFQLGGRGGKISSLIFLSDGKRIVCSSKAEKSIQLWNIGDRDPTEPLVNHGVTVNAVTSSKDGNFIITGDVDGKVVVWDTSLQKRCEAAGQHGGGMVTALDVFQQYIATGSNGGTIALWKTREPGFLAVVPGPLILRHGSRPISSVKFSPVGNYIASASAHWGWSVRIWHTQTGDQLASIPIESPTHSLAWSSEGRRLFAGCSNGFIHCFDTITRKPFSKVIEPYPGGDSITFLRISDSGQFLVSFSSPGRMVDIWDIRDTLAYKPLHSYGRCTSASTSPDDLYLASSGDDTKISIRSLSGVVEPSYFFHVSRDDLHDSITSFHFLAPRSFAESIRTCVFDSFTPVFSYSSRLGQFTYISPAALQPWKVGELERAEVILSREIEDKQYPGFDSYARANRALARTRLGNLNGALDDVEEVTASLLSL